MRIERHFLFWLAALIVFLLAVAMLKDVLLPFVIGLILAYALNPIAELLVRRGLPRAIASAIVVFGIVLMVALALWFLVPPLVGQVQSLGETMPSALNRLRGLLEDFARERLGERFAEFKAGLDKSVSELEINWSAILPGILRSLWAQGLAIVNLLSLALITPLVVFYLLADWSRILEQLDGWLPRDRAPTVRRLAGEMDAAVGAFIRGQGVVCLVLASFYAIALSVAGLRYGLLIGLGTGILSCIPFAGWALGFIVSVAMILVQAWPDLTPLYQVIGVFLVGMAVDSAILSPRIVGSRVGLHPLWLIFSLFVFSYALGFVGMLLAVPLAAAIAVLVRHGLDVYLDSEVYQGRRSTTETGNGSGEGRSTASQ
jgi:predicted PurR-regulated permease PerM